MPGLLVDENVAVLAAYNSYRIIAGAIAFRHWDLVGLTNLTLIAQTPLLHGVHQQ